MEHQIYGESRATGSAMLIFQRYGIDVTPIVFLAAVGRPAIAEEARRVGISAVAEVLHLADAGGGEPGGDIAGKVEQGMVRPRRSPEKTFVRPVVGLEPGDEFRP